VRSERFGIRGLPLVDLHYRSIGTFLLAYASRLSKGELFLETPSPWSLATPLKVRLHVPGSPAMELAGTVAWTRPTAIGPGQPPGMGINLISSIDMFGERIDHLAARYARLKILVCTADLAGRAVLGRYLQSLLTCDLVEWNPPETGGDRGVPFGELKVDLAVLDLDAPGGRTSSESVAAFVQDLRASQDPPQPAHATAAGRGNERRLPILLLAGSERSRSRAGLLEVDDVLPNPPALPELESAVMHALSRPAYWASS
jgi:Tfp pilus assembly protein PilZ/CheY-like chemotaxis protein